MLVGVTADTWLGVAAAITALAGLALSIFGFISGRKDATRRAEEICHEKLLAEQRVSEKLSEELHDLRLKLDEGER